MARRAAAAVASALAAGDVERLQRLVYLAGERDDSEVARLLVASVGSAQNEEDRRVVLQGLYEQSDREAKRLFSAFCQADEDAWGCPAPRGAEAVMAGLPPLPTDSPPPKPRDWAVDRLPGDASDVGVHATRLAWVGGLRGVRFEHNGSTLTAWMDGQAYTIVVYHVGANGDLPRVLGLLNTLARTRGELERWVNSRGGVAIGPGPVLEKAVADKVLLR